MKPDQKKIAFAYEDAKEQTAPLTGPGTLELTNIEGRVDPLGETNQGEETDGAPDGDEGEAQEETTLFLINDLPYQFDYNQRIADNVGVSDTGSDFRELNFSNVLVKEPMAKSKIKYDTKKQSRALNKDKFKSLKEESDSLFIFTEDNIIRQLCDAVVRRRWFTYFFFAVVMLNTLTQFMEGMYGVNYINYFITLLYIFEAVVKIIAHGFILNRNSYLKDSWNIFEFIILLYK
jgi:hypothetical protein